MRFIYAFLFIVLGVTTVRADDWPQWMGPKRDNIWREKGILDTFPKGGPKVLWRAKVANGFSGPAVADGMVFITDFVTKADITADNFDREKFMGNERVLCLDAKTGDVKWKHEYPVTYTVSYPNGPRCTPNYEAGKVYTLGAEGNLFCFDAANGKILWSRDFRKDYKLDKSPLWGFAAHPLIDGNRLICLVGGDGSLVVAFDKTNGKEIWKALTPGEEGVGYSPPTLIEAAGVRQLLIWHPESLNGLNPEDGKVYWSVKQETKNGTSIMAPRVLDNYIFLGAWMRKGQMLKLDDKKPGATTLWKGNARNSLYPVNNTPFLENGHIYGVDTEGELRCVDMKDGERKWETYAPVAGEMMQSGTAHLVKNENRFFIFGEKGTLVIAKLSPEKYEEISRWEMLTPTSKIFGREVAWSHPAFANQCVYARNDRELVCASLAK